jgi:deoxyadenosine/deoxycytidine kinase
MNFALPPQTIIEVVGNVGTGKTTLAKKLATQLKAKYLDIDPYVTNPFLPLYVKNKKKWAFITALHFSYERSKLVQKVNKTLPYSIVLDHGFESGLYMYPWSSYALGEMTHEEWSFLQNLHSNFTSNLPEIQISIFLQLDSISILKRLKERGRIHEASYSQEYIEQLQKGLDRYKNLLLKKGLRESIIEYNSITNTLRVHGKHYESVERSLC